MTAPKTIFLDMDGVLCTVRAHIGQGERGMMRALDREAMGLLNVLAEVPGTPVLYVLSSTWRMIYDRPGMESNLRQFGWRGEFHGDWCTIQDRTGHRGVEVADWLLRHPEVTDWVAIDDDSDFLPDQKSRLALTHAYDGLRWQDFLDACRILHGDEHAWHRT